MPGLRSSLGVPQRYQGPGGGFDPESSRWTGRALGSVGEQPRSGGAGTLVWMSPNALDITKNPGPQET